MRAYIFSDRERNVLKNLIEKGDKSESYLLIHRIKKYGPRLKEDLELMVLALEASKK